MADIYNNISFICFIAAGVTFCIAIFLFFKMGIKKIISDLSGHTAKVYMREQQERKISNENRVYIEDRRPEVRQSPVQAVQEMPGQTESTQTTSQTVAAQNNAATSHNNQTDFTATEKLSKQALEEAGGTTVLGAECMEATTVLSPARLNNPKFIVEKNIVVIHANVIDKSI